MTIVTKILKKRGLPLFLATVALPTSLATIYFGLLASDVYVSESRFVVRSSSKPSASPLGAILGGGGLSNASGDSYAVVDYVESRNALADSNRDGLVRKIYSRSDISLFDRFDSPFRGESGEHLYEYFGNKVAIEFDASTQVTTMTVKAYTPEDARQLSERLLQSSEQLINRLSERGRIDAIQSAQAQVDKARTAARNATVALAEFRNSSGVIDPEKQAEINLQMVSKLQDALISERAQLAQLQLYTPRNPQIPAVRTRIKTLQQEIAQLAGNTAGTPRSLSAAGARYQQLQFDAEFAGKQLATALAALQEAEGDARRKQIFVERIAAPNLPDYPLEPRRIRSILATLVLSLLLWGVIVTLIAGIREHRD